VSECDRETWIMKKPWPSRGCNLIKKTIIIIINGVVKQDTKKKRQNEPYYYLLTYSMEQSPS
jgi:hypothetical protein